MVHEPPKAQPLSVVNAERAEAEDKKKAKAKAKRAAKKKAENAGE